MKNTRKLKLTAVVLIASAIMSGCGSTKDRKTPGSGDALPAAPVFQLSDWCNDTTISEAAKKTLDVMIRSMAASDCTEFEYRYSRLERRKLALTFENLTDPGPILSLQDLQELSIRGNAFSSLNWTRDLEQLVVLDASQNPLASASGVLRLKNIAPILTDLLVDNTGLTQVIGSVQNRLTMLSVSQNKIVDLQFIETLPNLVSLVVENNDIARIEILSVLTSLKTLNLSLNPIENLNVLAGMAALKGLSLVDHEDNLTLSSDWLPAGIENLRLGRTFEPLFKADLSRLHELTKLRSLNVDGRAVSGDFSIFTGLNDFSVESGTFSDPAILSLMPGLQSLNIRSSGLVDLPLLTVMTGLNLLVADRNQFSDVDGRNLPSGLKSMSLEYSGVRNLTHMTDLTALAVLSLKGNSIDSIDDFSWPPVLTTLDLSANRISRLQSLETLSRLSTLHLARNRISNIAPLGLLLDLSWLDLSGNQLDTIAPLSVLTKLNMLDIRSNGLSAAVTCPLVIPAACLF